MTAKEINNVVKLEVNHCLYGSHGDWYHNLRKFPAALFDKDGFVVYQSKRQYENDIHLKHSKKSLHVEEGISSIPGYTFYTKEQRKLLSRISSKFLNDDETVRKIRQIDVVLRKQWLVEKIKKLYKHQCQICGIKLKVGENKFYSEVHHVKPLGFKHGGPDKIENMISVCPNDHVRLDLGAISIQIEQLCIVKHKVHPKYIVYHNTRIYTR